MSTDKGETHFLLQVEGDSLYKSYMRQGLWDRPYREPGAMESAGINNGLTSILQATHGKPPIVTKIRPSLKQLKTKLDKGFGRSSSNVVVGVPLSLSVQCRNEIHTEMHDAGFHVLSTIRQPALASTLFEFHHEEPREEFFTSFIVDYNRASLDLAVTPTAYGASDVLAQQTYPHLGEDALDLKIASLILNETVQGRQVAPLGDLAQQIRLRRHRALDSKTNSQEIRLRKSKRLELGEFDQNQSLWTGLDFAAFAESIPNIDFTRLARATEVERDHYMGILRAIDDFVNQHSYNADSSKTSVWSPRLTEKSNMLMSGDADESGFQALRMILDQSDVDWPLDSAKNSPNPRQVSARGAAVQARKRVMEAEQEKEKQTYTERWPRGQERKQQVKLMVPHDL